MRDLNRAYKAEPALWELDYDGTGFWWIEANDADNNVFAFARRSRDSERVVVFVANLSPVPREGYRLGLPRSGRWREAVNTDSGHYGGSDVGNLGGVEAGPIAWHEPAVLGRGRRCRRSAPSGWCPRTRIDATDSRLAASVARRGRTSTVRLHRARCDRAPARLHAQE